MTGSVILSAADKLFNIEKEKTFLGTISALVGIIDYSLLPAVPDLGMCSSDTWSVLFQSSRLQKKTFF